MDTTFKDEILKAIAKSKTDKLALSPIADQLQDEFKSLIPESVTVDTEEEVGLHASYTMTDGTLKKCVLIMSVNDENDNELSVILTEEQTLEFAQKLLGKYKQINSLNDKLKDLGISE